MLTDKKTYDAPSLEPIESGLMNIIALSERENAADPDKDWEVKGRSRTKDDEEWEQLLETPPQDAWKHSLW